MIRTLLLSTVAAVALTGAASAADLPVRTAAPAPVYAAPAFTWTGFYVGAHVGYGWGESKWRPVAVGAFATPKPSGILGGVQAGYNWQVSSIVLGLEGDISTGVRDTSLWSNPAFGARARTDYLASIRGRLGFAAGNALFYVTGGAGFADWKYSTITFGTGLSNSKVGWTLGAGVEYAINNNWSVKGEYLHYDFGSVNAAVGTLDTVVQRVKTSVDTVKIGINYKFGGPSAVVAKY